LFSSWLVITAIFTTLALAGIIFYLWIKRVKLERKTHEEFTRLLLNTQERERKRLASELHDGMGQNLLVIKNNALLCLKTPGLPQNIIEKLNSISDISSSTLSDVRSISHNLRPVELDRFGLTEAINSAIEKVKDSVDFTLKSNVENIDSIFENEMEISIYRIVQESLNNAAKYSGASEVELRITNEIENLIFTIEDNGRGFDVDTAMSSAGSGIRSIIERVNLLDGEYQVRSSPGNGTKVTISIPIERTSRRLPVKLRTSAGLFHKAGEAAPKHNLPNQSKSFIGREKELLEIRNLLTQTNLLTLTGSGGTGKTTLSIQAGSDMADEFRNGVRLVELASLSEARLITQAIAAVFELHETDGTNFRDAITNHLKDKEILLIIDNCEHLIKDCALVVNDLLGHLPQLKIITTSREPLNIASEKTYRVPPLSYPAAKKKYRAKDILRFESVKLFNDRAVKAREDFLISDLNAASVANICSRLDGIPFAIELAAARVSSLTVEDISGRLDNRFHILNANRSVSLPRQQTLAAMIEWSYNLLGTKEQLLLKRLSVFSGGWDLKSAESVCAGEGLEPFEVLDLMESLHNRSLIEFEEEKYRYSMLETVREFTGLKLKEEGNDEKYHSMHVDYFFLLAKQAHAMYDGPEQTQSHEMLSKEYDNLRAALASCIRYEALSSFGLRICGFLLKFWLTRCSFTEGIYWFEETLKFNITDDSLKAHALQSIGLLCQGRGDFNISNEKNEEALIIFNELDDKMGILKVLNSIGVNSMHIGDHVKGIKCFENALTLSRELGDKSIIGSCLSNLGLAAFDHSELDKAQAYCEEALALQREIGNKEGISSALNTLGNVSFELGDHNRAITLYEEALALRKEIGFKEGIATSLGQLGFIAKIRGDYKKALLLNEEALAIRQEIEDKAGVAFSLCDMGIIAFERGDIETATRLHEESLALRHAIGDKSGIAASHFKFADIAKENGDLAKAEQLCMDSIAVYKELSNLVGVIEVLIVLSSIALRKNDIETSTHKLKEALVYCRDVKTKSYDHEILEGLALSHKAAGEPAISVTLLAAANSVRERIQVPIPLIQKPGIDAAILELRTALGEGEFEKVWQSGKSIRVEEALKLAAEEVTA